MTVKIIIFNHRGRVVSAMIGGVVLGNIPDIGVVLLRLHALSRTCSSRWKEPQPGYSELHITFDLAEQIDVNDLIPDAPYQVFKVLGSKAIESEGV